MSEIIEKQLTSEQKETLRYVARLIMKGSAGREQGKGVYFGSSFRGFETEKYCCAIGACLIAACAPEDNSLTLSDYLEVSNWPEINYPADVPAWKGWNSALYGYDYSKVRMNLVDVIMQLNDAAGWSFRRIAAYLRLAAQRGVVITTTA